MAEVESEASGIMGEASGSLNPPPEQAQSPNHQLQQAPPPPPQQQQEGDEGKSWHSYISEDLPRTVVQSTDSAIRSARSLQHTSSTHLQTLRVLSLSLSPALFPPSVFDSSSLLFTVK